METRDYVQVAIGAIQLFIIVVALYQARTEIVYKLIPDSLKRLEESAERDRRANKRLLKKMRKLQEAVAECFTNYADCRCSDDRQRRSHGRKRRKTATR